MRSWLPRIVGSCRAYPSTAAISEGKAVSRIIWSILPTPGRRFRRASGRNEPFVSLILTAFGFLGIVVALILKLSGDLPHFPFWLMMAFSIGAVLLLMAYHVLIEIFSR